MQCIEERVGMGVEARELLSALDALQQGDFSVRLSATDDGVAADVAEAFYKVVEGNERLVAEPERVSQLVAKAMKGDRQKCVEAGAWEQLSKPVDPEQTLAVLRARIRC
jgi:CheY-like chemotaxis protein